MYKRAEEASKVFVIKLCGDCVREIRVIAT